MVSCMLVKELHYENNLFPKFDYHPINIAQLSVQLWKGISISMFQNPGSKNNILKSLSRFKVFPL